MRFVSFSTAQLPRPHLGLVHDNQVLDVDLAGRALQQEVPDQLQELIDSYSHYLPVLHTLLEKAGGRLFSEVQTFNSIGAAQDINAVQLYAPIYRPRKNVFCVGTNYREHIAETAGVREHQGDIPQYPVFFTKAPTTVTGPYANVEINPAVSSEIDWEAELAVVLGKRGRNIRVEDALSYVFGYTVANDITARDLQSRHKQFFKGKSLDTSCPLGPFVVTADEINDPQNLGIRLRVNGEIKQESNTSQMIFSVAQIIASLSAGMTLEPGDIICTGTPSGVGFTRKPAQFLRPGDIVEAEVESIGALRNPVIEVEN